jgi:hypothetical protein
MASPDARGGEVKTNTLVLVGLLGASLAGCDVRCLSSKESPAPKTPSTGTGDKVNVRPADYQGADAGKPGQSPALPTQM